MLDATIMQLNWKFLKRILEDFDEIQEVETIHFDDNQSL